MAKQIILTQNNFGIPIELQFMSNTNSPVDLTDKTVEVAISYDGIIIDVLQATISSYTNGTAYIVTTTRHTSNVGLYTTFWSVRDEYGYITAQSDLYYYVKEEYNGAETPGIEQDKGTIEEKFNEINSSIGLLNEENSVISTRVSGIEIINSQLTNDIETINSQLDTIETQIQDFINIDMFNNGDDTTDTTRFINAFNYCKTNNARLQLNAKTYYINADTIEYDGSFSLQGVGKEKTAIVCNNEGDIFINTPKTTNIRNGIISNLSINGNYKCKIGLLFFGKKNIIRDCAIKNFTDYQIKLGDGEFRAWETEITRCFIQGCANDTNDTNKLPNTLVWYTLSATDNFMSDCVVTNCSDISIIDDGANNRFFNVHTFGYPDNHRQKTCFKLNGAYSSVIQCPLDTPKESGVIITGYNNNISLNSCFWNKEFQSTGIENFVVIDNTGGRCANNIISSNMTTYFGTNLSKSIKISGNDVGNVIYNNNGNISNDNGNQTFLHPNNYLVINRDGTWYNPLGVNRDLLNIKTPLTLKNNWIAFDGDEVFVRKNELGIPVLFGRISGGTEDNGTTIFTLPWQYRPSKYTSMQAMYRAKDDSYKVCEIGISGNGSVVLNGVSNCKYLLLNNVQILY